MSFISPWVVEYIIDVCNYFIISIYRYLEIEYLEDFVTGDIVLAPPNISVDIIICREVSVNSALIEWHWDEGLGLEQKW